MKINLYFLSKSKYSDLKLDTDSFIFIYGLHFEADY